MTLFLRILLDTAEASVVASGGFLLVAALAYLIEVDRRRKAWRRRPPYPTDWQKNR